jgi:zinc/manganese transport system substrate-binding protein
MAFHQAAICLLTLLLAARTAQAVPVPVPVPVPVVAAENFYADVARQVGGDLVRVTAVLSNPNQDPHMFEVTPSVARAVSAARIVIANGAGYDPWMENLVRSAAAPGRQMIVVADLVGRRPGDDPHVWYDPASMLALANALVQALSTADPLHGHEYAQNGAAFAQSLAPLRAALAALRQAHGGTPVTATEPVFAYAFRAMGLHVRNLAFQTAVMNDTEPSAAAIAAFQTGLQAHEVKLLVYNSQVADPVATRMRTVAHDAGIPIVPVTETEPAGVTYQQWMLAEIRQVAAALEPGQ